MFSDEEKKALEKIRRIDNVETRLTNLLEEIKKSSQYPKQIFDEYIKETKRDLELREKQLREEKSFFDKMLQDNYETIQKLYEEKSQGFPWLAKAYSEYSYLCDLKIREWLEKKKHPAEKTADLIREIGHKRREAEGKFRITKYLLEMYESLFPFLIDFKGQDLDDYIRVRLEKKSKENEELEDEVIVYTTEGERETLTKQEIFQRGLDRYWQKKKGPWELGRDFERYVGYLYEKDGYSVYYQGIIEGFEDLGRDLIVKKGNEIEIVQCKYWSKDKIIHEKHVCQLFGTTLKYWVENQKQLQKELKIKEQSFPQLIQNKQIKGVFITSTSLSEKAREFADELGIIVKEKFPFKRYPSIKCNVSLRTKEKIYHLPFDQQYDRALIVEEKNECYVETIAEAEKLGFRRAFRWRGYKDSK